MSVPHTERLILFFDGVCDLCNNAVTFVIRHDKQKRFLFAPLQSEAGKEALQALRAEGGKPAPDSIVLYYKGKYYLRSSAVLRAAKLLGGGLSLVSAFLIVPPFIRNTVYDWVARNRYRWFGKRDACMIPTPELKSRFLS